MCDALEHFDFILYLFLHINYVFMSISISAD